MGITWWTLEIYNMLQPLSQNGWQREIGRFFHTFFGQQNSLPSQGCLLFIRQFQLRFLPIWDSWHQLTMGQLVLGALMESMEHWDQDHLPDQLQEVGPPDELTGGVARPGDLLILGETGPKNGHRIWRILAWFFWATNMVEVMWFNHQKKGFNWFWCVSNKTPSSTALLW